MACSFISFLKRQKRLKVSLFFQIRGKYLFRFGMATSGKVSGKETVADENFHVVAFDDTGFKKIYEA